MVCSDPVSRMQPHEIANRLIDWHDEAARAGKAARADRLLDLAWCVLDALGHNSLEPASRSTVC